MDFRQTLAWLRETFPTRRKVVVRRCKCRNHGCTSLADNGAGQITVTIRKSDDHSVQIHTLLHEWAHVREMDDWEPHGPPWQRLYGVIYQAWEKT